MSWLENQTNIFAEQLNSSSDGKMLYPIVKSRRSELENKAGAFFIDLYVSKNQRGIGIWRKKNGGTFFEGSVRSSGVSVWFKRSPIFSSLASL